MITIHDPLSAAIPASVSPAAVANLLEGAEKVHLPRSVVFLSGEAPISLVGSVRVVAYGRDGYPIEAHDMDDLVRAAELALRAHLKTDNLTGWSEAHTPEEQREALRDTAATIRAAIKEAAA